MKERFGKPKKILATNFLGVFLLLLSAPFLYSQENSDCLMCHDVDTKKLEASVHGGFACVDCHTDITSLEHEASPGRWMRVPETCGQCHDVEAAGRGLPLEKIVERPLVRKVEDRGRWREP